jgi:phosphoglucomutase
MSERTSPDAGRPLHHTRLVNVPRLISAYFLGQPDPAVAAERVSFGTSGHRGSSFANGFNEAHILATTQAICLYRARAGIDGPLFLGRDTHALSEPAFASALEVLAANGVATVIDAEDGYTPTPAISHAILTHNRGRTSGLADGIVITPSHNPPEDGGFKYNPTHGGPAGTDATDWIERIANEMLADGLKAVKRLSFAQALKAGCVQRRDFAGHYVEDLAQVIDMEAIRAAGLRVGIDPLGGAATCYWGRIIDRYGINGTVVDDQIDPTFRFMPADWDGKIRMDCSSPFAMARLVGLRDRFDIAFGNDTDTDRHGIVTPSTGLMNPNHYLAAAIAYLFGNRDGWRADAAIGKTLVSSSIIDRIAARLGRRLYEVPVGFKWFVDGLLDGSVGFGGEESAGASFLRRDGGVWTTDKDGLILGLLAAEMTARTGRDPGQQHAALADELGRSYYERMDVAASAAQRKALKNVTPDRIPGETLAGDAITQRLSRAPGNDQPIGGIKVATARGWFAARPSGTEDIYKIYAESFVDEGHLRQIQAEAQAIVAGVFAAA